MYIPANEIELISNSGVYYMQASILWVGKFIYLYPFFYA